MYDGDAALATAPGLPPLGIVRAGGPRASRSIGRSWMCSPVDAGYASYLSGLPCSFALALVLVLVHRLRRWGLGRRRCRRRGCGVDRPRRSRRPRFRRWWSGRCRRWRRLGGRRDGPRSSSRRRARVRPRVEGLPDLVARHRRGPVGFAPSACGAARARPRPESEVLRVVVVDGSSVGVSFERCRSAARSIACG